MVEHHFNGEFGIAVSLKTRGIMDDEGDRRGGLVAAAVEQREP